MVSFSPDLQLLDFFSEVDNDALDFASDAYEAVDASFEQVGADVDKEVVI